MEKHSETYQSFLSLLKKLQNGTLSGDDRQRLDAMAAQDEFYRDALEGYQESRSIDHAQVIADLKSKVSTRSSQKEHRRIPIWMRGAAAALVLLSSVWLLRTIVTNPDQAVLSESQEVAKDELPVVKEQEKLAFELEDDEVQKQDGESIEMVSTSDPDKEKSFASPPSSPNLRGSRESGTEYYVDGIRVESPEKDEPTNEEHNSELVAADAAIESPVYAQKRPAIDSISAPEVLITQADGEYQDEKTDLPVSDQVEADFAVAEQDSQMTDDLAAAGSLEQKKLVDSSTNQMLDSNRNMILSRANAMPQINLSRTIIGKILDPDGYPVIGANILEPKSGEGTLTDIDGRFSITLPEPNDLRVSFVGYEDYEIKADQLGQFVEIQLVESDLVLDEVVITGYQAKKRQETKAYLSNNDITAEPVKGFGKYEAYISSQAKYPYGYDHNSVDGLVEVRFQIDDKGKPIRFEVTKSFNPIYNAEAIRLIKKGGKWKTDPKGQSGWVTYNVQF